MGLIWFWRIFASGWFFMQILMWVLLIFQDFSFFAWLFDNFDAISNMGQWFYFGLFAILMQFFFMLVCFDSQGFLLGCAVQLQILMWVLALKDFVCFELNFWCNLVIFSVLGFAYAFHSNPQMRDMKLFFFIWYILWTNCD